MKETSIYHIPVLSDEVLHYLALKPGGIYVDATFGGGGHTKAILDAFPDVKVIALDWDATALEINGEPLKERYKDRLTLVWGNFAQLDKIVKKLGVLRVDGILADFGTSQYQLIKRPGFSFQYDTPLDMRMSPAHQKVTAADILNKASEDELIHIFTFYGQEPKARAIARGIVQRRKEKKFRTTKDLVDVTISVLGQKKEQRIHPSTRIFQALRIAVNQELDNIKSFLIAAVRMLVLGGRLVCISFHSLEDRLVKDFFRQQVIERKGKILTPKAVMAQESETVENPSARSARLRALEIII